MGSRSPFGDVVLQYPVARRDESVVEDYHGVMIADPYRWLEEPDSEETKEFVNKQNKLTETVLKSCEVKEKLHKRLTESNEYDKYDCPYFGGDKLFYRHNTGLQPESVLYIQDGLEGKPEVLIDPNTYFTDENVTFADYIIKISEDAKYMVYGTTICGSDFISLKIMRIEDRRTLPDTISWVKFTKVSWTHDNKGFFYSSYPAPGGDENSDIDAGIQNNINQDVYYHFLGTDQSEDILCWSDPENPTQSRKADVTDDGKYLLLFVGEHSDTLHNVYYCDLSSLPKGLEGYKGSKELLPFVNLVNNFEGSYTYVANDETIFTFLTNKDAPRYKVVQVDLKEPTSWTDIVEEHERDVLETADAAGDNKLVLNYLSDVKNVLQIRDLRTGELLHHLPLEIGAVSEVKCRRKDSLFFVECTSFLVPGIVYTCNLEGDEPDLRIYKESVVPGLDKSEFDLSQVFVPSKDGKAKIPMYIVTRKGLQLDGSHPALLYGYGGFNIRITPSFSCSRMLLTKHLDVVVCTANIRGGGEYGIEWNKAAVFDKKQVTFDDFISVSEYLVSAGYTQPSKLCIEGASGGGLLVGACITQRPDLFGCAIADCSVFDMLRFHKFTIGYNWISDWGCPDKEEEFHWLIKYSPLHNVRRPWDNPSTKHVQYPPTMLCAADHDDRVVPLHTHKFLATLQYELCLSVENSPQTNPIIGRIDLEVGHGSGMSTQDFINEAVDQFAFMAKAVGATWVD
ncbi:hypothetical protein ACS0TY_014007 [Phlomoides rotata]